MKTVRPIPSIVKWAYTLFLLILIPCYWVGYGSENFLWISDVALFFLYAAILFESKVLASMATTGNIAYATAWILDFFYTLLSPTPGYTKYMVDDTVPLWLRALSLFHLALPPLMLWTIGRLGYDPRAWRYQIAVSTALLFFTWFISNPESNINLAFGYQDLGWKPFSYLIVMSLLNGLLVACTHSTIRWWVRARRQ